jgi:hypothetical protein
MRRQSMPFSSRAMGRRPPPAGKGTKRSAKDNKRGPKWHPQQIAVTTSCDEGDNDKEVDDSYEEHVIKAERDFMCQP